MIRLMSFLAIGLIVEMVFFGPLGLTIVGIPVRKVLIGALIATSIVPTLTQKPVVTWQITLLLSIILFLVVWGGIVPMTNGVRFDMAFAEVQPLIGLLLIFPFYHLFRTDGPRRYLNILQACVAVMALIVMIVWVSSNVLGMTGIGLAAREFYIGLNNNDTGVYIGPMPDGSFRVMLINFILFPIMLCYHNWSKTNFFWSVFYSAAVFATGTRAFLGVAAFIIGVSLLRRRPLLVAPIVVAVGGLAIMYTANLQNQRVFDLNQDFTSSAARFVQFFSLMNLFWQHPLFGAGFGANAAVIRSADAPYSYELTYVALLAKLGIIGLGILILAVVTWATRLMRNNSDWTSIASLLIAFFMMTSTNPYLINSVGITIVAVLIALGAQVRTRQGQRLLPVSVPAQGVQ